MQLRFVKLIALDKITWQVRRALLWTAMYAKLAFCTIPYSIEAVKSDQFVQSVLESNGRL